MLNILYEDNHVIVVEKPAGILSQSDITQDQDMLTLVKEYIKVKYNKPGNVYVGLVHRLDRMTGGLMVFAKTSKAAARLSESIRKNELVKKYYCICEGNIQGEGSMKDKLSKNEEKKMGYIDKKDGKEALLDYKVIEKKNNLSLVDITLHSGRFHQIRVQFSSRGYILYGDVKYGSKIKDDLKLYCHTLGFHHPTTKEYLEFKFSPKGKIWNDYLK